MIPMVLKLENFMSHASLDFDFSGLHCAVLTGANGAGKSSLLDAITYALWEKARAAPEQLIRLGQSEMWVELTFEVEGETYRVFRRRTRKTGVGSQLELHQRQGDDWVPLTGTTTRETQARIHQAVRMDFETFINSAYLRQGRADEFTTKTPQERKAVLAEILGLSAYDDLALRAREKWKATQARADALASEQAELREALEGREALDARLVEVRTLLTALGEQLAAAEAERTRLADEGQSLHAAEARRQAIVLERGARDAERRRIDAGLAEAAAAIEAAGGTPANQASIDQAYADWRRWSGVADRLRRESEAHQALERELATEERLYHQAAHQAELAMQTLDAELDALDREADAQAGLLKDRERIEQAQAVLAAARSAEAVHLGKVQAARELETRELALVRQWQRAQLSAEAARRDLAERLTRAMAAAEQVPVIAAELAAAEGRLRALDIATVEQERAKEKGFQHRARATQLREAIAQAQAAGKAKLARAAGCELAREPQATVAPDRSARRADEPHCPLCASTLDGAGLARLAQQWQAEAQGFADEADRLDHLLADVEGQLAEARARYAGLGAKLKQRDAQLRELGALSAQLALAEQAQVDIERLRAELEAILEPAEPAELSALRHELAQLGCDPAELSVLQARIADNRWSEARGWQLEQALGAIKKIADRRSPLITRRAAVEAVWHAEQDQHHARAEVLRSELAAHAPDASAHAEAQSRLGDLAGAPEAWSALQQQLVALAAAQGRLAQLEAERARVEAGAARDEAEWVALGQTLSGYEAWREAQVTQEAALASLRDQERRRLGELGGLEADASRLADLAERLSAREAEWQTAVSDAQAYKELTVAFGKNGIQAILIENAIPELEEEANRLLARMTDNRMHVRLATQKEKKGGGVHETLEIVISDEVGTRQYELYSGGEAFRVNFALRLALSRLLARRAGAKLQILIIDEGFGTQDERGREKLVEAINAVSGEFARILVITHIRELKDAFNTQIEVVKRGGVSEVRAIA